jgi:hypothetical protein
MLLQSVRKRDFNHGFSLMSRKDSYLMRSPKLSLMLNFEPNDPLVFTFAKAPLPFYMEYFGLYAAGISAQGKCV